VKVAPELLGKFLCKPLGNRVSKCFMITEVEAYDGFRDKASHASRGWTARNAPMFGEAGRWYVYFTYGMHWMLNIVTGPKDYPAAVLIRGIADPHWLARVFPNLAQRDGVSRAIRQQANMRVRKNVAAANEIDLNGPGKLTKALKIDKKFNGLSASRRTGFWIEDRGIKISKNIIKRTPRIGVSYAQEWATKKYRFIIK